MKVKEQVKKVNEKLDKPMTINTEMYNPFNGSSENPLKMEKGLSMGGNSSKSLQQPKDEEYCTCENPICKKCGKKVKIGVGTISGVSYHGGFTF